MLTRRQFIQTTSFAGISPFLMNTVPFVDSLKSFRASLNPGAIGLQCNARELLDYAIMFNFSSISPLLNELVAFSPDEKKAYLEKMISHGIQFDGGGLPIEFRSSEKIFQQGLKFLQKNIKIFSSFNIPSFVTWIMPTHKSLTYHKNFNQHQKRLQQVATVLGEEGISLGLEYVGPKTLMIRDKYSFLHTIFELRELINAIDKENIYAVSVLSGNRNFEGRISPHIKANYLASPPLVVAYALAGHMEFDLYKEPLGKSKEGKGRR